MDPSRVILYRGVVLNDAAGGPGGTNPIVGMRISRASYSDVTVHGYTEKNALKDGMAASDVFIGMRRVELVGEVYGKTKGEVFDRLTTLRYACSPTTAYSTLPGQKGYHPLAFEVPTERLVDWPSGYILQAIDCRPAALPAWNVTIESLDVTNARGFVIPVALLFEAREPRIYHPVRQVSLLLGTSGSGSIRNRGSYPAPVRFILRRSAGQTGQAIFSFVGLGANMTVTIPAGTVARSVLVDCADRVVYYRAAGQPDVVNMGLIDTNRESGSLWPLAPPVPEGDVPVAFSWTCTQALDTASEMSFAEAWV